MKYQIGVVGFGVMGQAIIKRILSENTLKPQEVAVFDIAEEKIKAFPYEISVCNSFSELISSSERILFAVKPQHYAELCKETDFGQITKVMSIMAGVKINVLKSKLNNFRGSIVRIMPNTPCANGKGVCGVAFDGTDETEKLFVEKMLSACGGVVILDESKFDAVTSVSGSGPAYVYMFAKGMIEGGMNGGLSYEESKQLALNTIIGAADLALNSEENLDTLVDKVCSKGGTTIEAVEVYKDKNLVEIVAEGVEACRKKSALLSEKL